MFTLTSLAVLSGLLSGITVSNDTILNNYINNNNNKAIVRSVDGWSENSIKNNLSNQSSDNGSESNSSNTQKITVSDKVNYSLVETGDVLVSAYSSTADQTDDTPFIMASGKHVYSGAIATNFLPLGAKVRFPDQFGERIFTVEDRMNKRYQYKMDIWMGTRDQALNFGLKKLKYEVVEKANGNTLAVR